MMTKYLYRIVRRIWFDECGIQRGTVYQVQKRGRGFFGVCWVTITHSTYSDGSRSATEFKNEDLAMEFIQHLLQGGAVQKWVEEVLPGDWG